MFFFFSQEKFKIHSLTQIQNGEKKKNSPVKKKKTGFSLTQSIFSKMWSKLNYSGEKKNTVPLGEGGPDF